MIVQGEIGWDINLRSFDGLESVELNSYGGSLFDGFALHDYVQSKGLKVGVIGVAASAATLPLVASPTRWGTPNSRYLIHNPRAWAEGDAAQVGKTAAELENERQALISLYEKKLTIPRAEIENLLNSEIWLTAEEALRIGLINEIRDAAPDELVMPERDNHSSWYFWDAAKNIQNMVFKNKKPEGAQGAKPAAGSAAPQSAKASVWAQIKNLLGFTNVVLQDVNGVSLDFGADVDDQSQVVLGTSGVLADGVLASGTYTMPDGTAYTIEAGVVTEITSPAASEPDDQQEAEPANDLQVENDALRAENTALREQLAASQNSVSALTNRAETAENSLTAIKNKLKSLKIDNIIEQPATPAAPATDQKKQGFTFKNRK